MAKTLTQTQLGEEFGLSSIAMGKKLIELNLRDKDTKLATDFAIQNKLAKNVKYSKGTQELLMTVWTNQSITYIKNKTKKDENFLSIELFGKFFKLKQISDDDTQGDKLQQMNFDWHYEEFTKIFNSSKESVKNLFYKKIEEHKLISYAQDFDIFVNLEKIILKKNLESDLSDNNHQNKKLKI